MDLGAYPVLAVPAQGESKVLIVCASGGRVARALMHALSTTPGRRRVGTLKGHANVATIPEFEHVTVQPGSAADRARLLEGISNLVVLPTWDQALVEHQIALVASAAAAGVKRIHMISLHGADPRSPVRLLRWLASIEREIKASGLPNSILRCAPFMQNIAIFTETRGAEVSIAGPFHDITFPWIDARDVGEIVRGLVVAQNEQPIACELTGPDDVGFQGVASMLQSSLGRPVHYTDISMPEARGALEARGVPATRARAITEYWDYLTAGVVKPCRCPTALEYLGHPQRTLDGFLGEFAAELRTAA